MTKASEIRTEQQKSLQDNIGKLFEGKENIQNLGIEGISFKDQNIVFSVTHLENNKNIVYDYRISETGKIENKRHTSEYGAQTEFKESELTDQRIQDVNKILEVPLEKLKQIQAEQEAAQEKEILEKEAAEKDAEELRKKAEEEEKRKQEEERQQAEQERQKAEEQKNQQEKLQRGAETLRELQERDDPAKRRQQAAKEIEEERRREELEKNKELETKLRENAEKARAEREREEAQKKEEEARKEEVAARTKKLQEEEKQKEAEEKQRKEQEQAAKEAAQKQQKQEQQALAEQRAQEQAAREEAAKERRTLARFNVEKAQRQAEQKAKQEQEKEQREAAEKAAQEVQAQKEAEQKAKQEQEAQEQSTGASLLQAALRRNAAVQEISNKRGLEESVSQEVPAQGQESLSAISRSAQVEEELGGNQAHQASPFYPNLDNYLTEHQAELRAKQLVSNATEMAEVEMPSGPYGDVMDNSGTVGVAATFDEDGNEIPKTTTHQVPKSEELDVNPPVREKGMELEDFYPEDKKISPAPSNPNITDGQEVEASPSQEVSPSQEAVLTSIKEEILEQPEIVAPAIDLTPEPREGPAFKGTIMGEEELDSQSHDSSILTGTVGVVGAIGKTKIFLNQLREKSDEIGKPSVQTSIATEQQQSEQVSPDSNQDLNETGSKAEELADNPYIPLAIGKFAEAAQRARDTIFERNNAGLELGEDVESLFLGTDRSENESVISSSEIGERLPEFTDDLEKVIEEAEEIVRAKLSSSELDPKEAKVCQYLASEINGFLSYQNSPEENSADIGSKGKIIDTLDRQEDGLAKDSPLFSILSEMTKSLLDENKIEGNVEGRNTMLFHVAEEFEKLSKGVEVNLENLQEKSRENNLEGIFNDAMKKMSQEIAPEIAPLLEEAANKITTTPEEPKKTENQIVEQNADSEQKDEEEKKKKNQSNSVSGSGGDDEGMGKKALIVAAKAAGAIALTFAGGPVGLILAAAFLYATKDLGVGSEDKEMSQKEIDRMVDDLFKKNEQDINSEIARKEVMSAKGDLEIAGKELEMAEKIEEKSHEREEGQTVQSKPAKPEEKEEPIQEEQGDKVQESKRPIDKFKDVVGKLMKDSNLRESLKSVSQDQEDNQNGAGVNDVDARSEEEKGRGSQGR